MKTIAFALVSTLLLAAPALAQSPAPDAGAPAAEPTQGEAPADAAPSGKGGLFKQTMQECRAYAKAQGLKGPDKKKAVMDCVVQKQPQFAGRIQCRQDGMAKGLKKDDLKAFVKDCVKSKG